MGDVGDGRRFSVGPRKIVLLVEGMYMDSE